MRHARKLAYLLDAGVAASGLAAFTAKKGIAGELPKGFALQSTAKGEIKAQTYETLAPLEVDATWNALRPADAMVDTPIKIVAGFLDLPLTRRHGLERNEIVLVEGHGLADVFKVVDPFDDAASPRIRLYCLGRFSDEDWGKAVKDGSQQPEKSGFRLHVRPQVEARVFGWNASAALYPPDKVALPELYPDNEESAASAGTVLYGYELPPDPAPVTTKLGQELFLAEVIKPPVTGALAALLRPTRSEVLAVDKSVERMILFKRGERIRIPDTAAADSSSERGRSSGSRAGGAIGDSIAVRKQLEFRPIEPELLAAMIAENAVALVTPTKVETIRASTSERVTALSLTTLPKNAANGAKGATKDPLRSWSAKEPFPLDGVFLSGWADSIEISPQVPNDAILDPSVVLLDADLARVRPGRVVILRHRTKAEVVEASIVELIEPVSEGKAWTVKLSAPSGIPPGWTKGEVEILGNVVRVSHGEAKTETLGGSDGVTAHQSLELKGAPVTRIPGALGAEMTLELRVAGVLWDIVEDFHEAGAALRVARSETDADGKVTVHFGGEGRGAVPPSGRRHIEAAYRLGLGTIGNIEAGRLSRIRKASPLLDVVTNPLPIAGGTDAAGSDDIALQATRPVRIFDRAVSVADHADLALLFPGVARASARWIDRGGIEVIAADVEGNGIADLAAFREFMNLRRDSGVPLILASPQDVAVAVTLRVERDQAWLPQTVRLAVEEALLGADKVPGLFTFAGRALSAPQSLSGLYACVLTLPGVTGVETTRFAIAPGNEVADILHATDRQWLSLRPVDLRIDLVDPVLLTVDEGGGT